MIRIRFTKKREREDKMVISTPIQIMTSLNCFLMEKLFIFKESPLTLLVKLHNEIITYVQKFGYV